MLIVKRIDKIISDIGKLREIVEGITPTLDIDQIHSVMSDLASQRPIFHSEADFKHALAWQLHYEGYDVRLEYPFSSDDTGDRKALDIWLPDGNIAIELKYRKSKVDYKEELKCNGEVFLMKEHSAANIGRYVFLKDVHRLEQWNKGYAILLTNDPSYWNPANPDNNDADFHLHEGRVLTGPLADKGDPKDRPKFSLAGRYTANWQCYSNPSNKKNGKFKYLAFQVPSPFS